MPLWHVALSVGDVRRTHRWYHETLGLMFARATGMLAGPMFSWIVGVRGAASSCWWLNDRQDLFQLELFEFRRPLTRALPAAWRPCDVGYTGISFHVDDLDATLQRAVRCGSPPLHRPIGPPGARRACVRDPDGVLIELMEEDPRDRTRRLRPRPDVPAVARSVTLSVTDLPRSRRLLGEGLGLREASEIDLHKPEHEAMWGLAGAERDSVVFWADDFLIEAVSYRQPQARAREPSYRISDRGLFHICFGSLDRVEFRDVLRQCRAVGFRGNSPAISFGATAGLYVVDDLGFTVELLRRHPRLRQATDATVRAPPRKRPARGGSHMAVRRRKRFDSAVVIGTDTRIGTELSRLLSEDGTSLHFIGLSEVGTSVATSALADCQLLVILPPALDRLAELVPGSSSRQHASPASCAAGSHGVQHVTLVAEHTQRRALMAVREQHVGVSSTCTLATLANPPASPIARALFERALLLTAREAAEAIYLATLMRRRMVIPRPSAWPPRRGASEAPTHDDVLLLPRLA